MTYTLYSIYIEYTTNTKVILFVSNETVTEKILSTPTHALFQAIVVIIMEIAVFRE